LKERPEVRFVVAGRDPHPELLRRACPQVVVTGEVPSLREEMARSALYVAPLRSGCGFKNKVIEALAAGTFVAGTRMATEFLPRNLRDALPTGDTPQALAERVLTFLKTPADFDRFLPSLMKIVADEYTWAARTGELLQIVRGAMGQDREQGRRS
jgi:glycosyltransferase involved in cell wall biosynthesis